MSKRLYVCVCPGRLQSNSSVWQNKPHVTEYEPSFLNLLPGGGGRGHGRVI